MTNLQTASIFKKLRLDEFVSLDLETTGLDFLREDIIEFGAVTYKNGQPVADLNFLIKPTKKIPTHITRITGISDKDVEKEKSFHEVLGGIQKFIGEKPIVAHNINFDLPFLEYHARKANNNFINWDYQQLVYHYFNNPKIDTLLLARIFLFFLPSTSLSNLKKYFQINTGEQHRALSDARATGDIFLELLEIALKTKLADIQKILQILEPTEDPIQAFFENLAILQASGKAFNQRFEGIDRESFTINANFYNIIGEGETPEHGRMETEPIDEQTIADFFDDAGELSQEFASFEIRKPQVKMAYAVAQAFNASKFLVVEAGTGTGKSMAYLVPAIKWATKNYGPNGRIIINKRSSFWRL